MQVMLPFLGDLNFGWRDICDISIVTILFYRLILIVRGTRILSAMYGIMILLASYMLSDKLGFYTLHWLLSSFLGSLFLVLVILFQNDIRMALSEVGTNNVFSYFFGRKRAESSTVDHIAIAAFKMSRQRMGALIVIEREMQLGDLLTKGVTMNADVSGDLLQAIFYPKNPLHDGAVVIRRNKILAAGCILPLSAQGQGKQAYGTRHRAALGTTEETDAMVVVVSEERGEVSLALQGTLTTISDPETLKKELESAMEARA